MADPAAIEGEDAVQPAPDQIWRRAATEGEHRLERSRMQLLATGLLGGFDILLGALAMVLIGSAILGVAGASLAELLGALGFGIGLALISIGRSELFTENFLVPLIAIVRHRGTAAQLMKLWGVTLVGNALGIAVLGLVVHAGGILEGEDRTEFAQATLERLLRDDWTETLATAVLAGIVMTLFTWLLHATSSDVARIMLAFGVGFLLVAPPLTHVVVAGAELALAVVAGASVDTSHAATVLAVALVGNVVGGVGFVTLARGAQVLSWPSR